MASTTPEPAATVEYFVGYGASSNASFHSREPEDDEWTPWEDDPPMTVTEVEEALEEPEDGKAANLPRGLSEALESSGFEWWVEVREIKARP